tara:strand:- start:80 stop:292 length:213 start_codon:yes stop_codon:yes gene_type:complete
MNTQNTTTINRLAEIEEAVTGFNPLALGKECKSDYTDSERISYIENRINGYSAKEAHQFIIEDREYVWED